ncbi:DUF1800 domain-containing protein [Antrihabitans cavernicola]|uniref:DUF1800 domain-containing protein n=1 Tax=Antrihabitans cavernicola TaxID=2495913 RepID=A0A5A7SIS4_9NOCA|nr:DUF1800 domain-containing protein [Spelaeibacter cavernicola]KAA0024131.1 DUF1800 domain-containing protein [Spelaeibacter cavernicola]
MAQSTEWNAAARVLRRTGFGATGQQIDAVVGQGMTTYLRTALAADPNADPGAVATPRPTFDLLPRVGKNAGQDARKRFNTEQEQRLVRSTQWWFRRMAAVREPMHEKLTLLWHNHFATSAQKVRSASEMVDQNEKLRTLGRGDFHTLAYSMLTDAAMLRWLDGTQNTAAAPNENLAREFMELFGLGHGNGYTEQDVREGARALTGWTVTDNGTASLNQRRHDARTKTVLGVTGPLDASGFCDAVLGHPASAGFVTGRLWEQLASATPPSAATSGRITEAYGAQRNLSAAIVAILTDPEFTGAKSTVVLTPVEWLVGAVRALHVPLDDDTKVKNLTAVLRNLGQLPFYPPSVGGWPSGQAWLSTASADARIATAAALTKTADLEPISGTTRSDRIDATGHLLGIGAWSARSAAVLKDATNDPARLVTLALNTPEYLTA